MQFNVTVQGSEELRSKLAQLTQELSVWPEEMKQIGELLKSYLSGQVYASQGGVFGTTWAPLNKKYSAQKSKKYPGRGTLVASGTMMQSYVSEPDDSSVTVSNTQTYAAYHQSGTSKMPQRVLFALNDQLVTDIESVFKKGIETRLNA